jgi:hypothetical protein
MRAHDDAAAGADGRPGSNERGAVLAPADASPPPAALRPCDAAPGRLLARRAGASSASLLLCALLAPACSELTEPPAHRRSLSPAPVADAPSAPSPAPSPTQVVAEKTPAVPVHSDQIEASHILVSYQGATRAKPTVTRTREQARELATQLAARAREPGTDFAQLAKDASDGPSGVEGGVLPRFGRQQMVKPFSDAAFALRPGEISDVVETNFGFHIIKRLQ